MTRVIDNTKTEIILGGELGEKYGRSHMLVVKTPVQALRLLALNFPEFKQDIIDGANAGIDYQFVIDDSRGVSANELNFPIGGQRMMFTAAVEGQKSGIFSIIEGAVLLVAAYFTAGASFAYAGQVATVAAGMGASLIMGGITSLLSTVPKQTGAAGDSLSSFYFNGPANTQQQGSPVALVYGRALIGSQAISASMQAVDLSQAPTETGNLT